MIEPEYVATLLARSASSTCAGKNLDYSLERAPLRLSRRRKYRVYLPESYNPQRRYPLMMVLHGCHQNHEDIQTITGFDAIADREGFVVVYPFVTSYSGARIENCWGWWLPTQRQRGRGEVADLYRIVQQVQETHAIDADRLHVCGLSSGAAMSVALLSVYSDVWCSGASIAGVPYGESSRSVKFSRLLKPRLKRLSTLIRLLRGVVSHPIAPLLVVQSSADQIVISQLGKNLRDAWLSVSGVSGEPCAEVAGEYDGDHWQFDQYKNSLERLQVACLQLQKAAHGWPGGLPGKFSIPCAPNASELVWAYFRQTQRDRKSTLTDHQ